MFLPKKYMHLKQVYWSQSI